MVDAGSFLNTPHTEDHIFRFGPHFGPRFGPRFGPPIGNFGAHFGPHLQNFGPPAGVDRNFGPHLKFDPRLIFRSTSGFMFRSHSLARAPFYMEFECFSATPNCSEVLGAHSED